MNTAKFLSAWLGFGIVLTLTIGGAGEGRSLAEAQDVFSFGGGTNGYEIHAADNGRNDLVWCIKETCRAMDDADPSPCGGWRMRVRSRLDSCGWTMGTAKFSVRLLASRTILLQFSENGFVESEKPEGERTFVLDGPGARACVPSGFLAVSMEMLRGGQPGAGITMCANGREFVHCEGVTAEYALFLIGHDVIAFSYRMGDAARPEISSMAFIFMAFYNVFTFASNLKYMETNKIGLFIFITMSIVITSICAGIGGLAIYVGKKKSRFSRLAKLLSFLFFIFIICILAVSIALGNMEIIISISTTLLINICYCIGVYIEKE